MWPFCENTRSSWTQRNGRWVFLLFLLFWGREGGLRHFLFPFPSHCGAKVGRANECGLKRADLEDDAPETASNLAPTDGNNRTELGSDVAAKDFLLRNSSPDISNRLRCHHGSISQGKIIFNLDLEVIWESWDKSKKFPDVCARADG